MKKLLLSALIGCILLIPNIATASDPERPDVSKWKLSSKSNISVLVSGKVKYYLGLDMIYQNPENPNEFVREIKVLIPFVVVKNRAKMDKNYTDMMTTYVTDGAERELLKTYTEKSDPILFIRWRIADDKERGTKKLVGNNEVWFWNSSGRWIYLQDTVIKTSSYSDNLKELGPEPIIVGLRYSLIKGTYNAREIPYAFLIVAVKRSK